VFIFSIYLYLGLATSYNEVFFWNWTAAQSTPFFIVIFSFIAPVLFVLTFKWLIPDKPEKSKYFDFLRYNGLKLIDAVSDHYTNVATVAVFFTVFIYTGTKLIANYDNGIVGVWIALTYIFLICFYAPYGLRLMIYVQTLKTSKLCQFLLVFAFLTFDLYLIQVFIEVAPKFSQKAVINS
jgi:hypothetical protein